MGVMSVMDVKAGEKKVIWNPDDPDEVERAEAEFTRLRNLGYLAYRLTPRGRGCSSTGSTRRWKASFSRRPW